MNVIQYLDGLTAISNVIKNKYTNGLLGASAGADRAQEHFEHPLDIGLRQRVVERQS